MDSVASGLAKPGQGRVKPGQARPGLGRGAPGLGRVAPGLARLGQAMACNIIGKLSGPESGQASQIFPSFFQFFRLQHYRQVIGNKKAVATLSVILSSKCNIIGHATLSGIVQHYRQVIGNRVRQTPSGPVRVPQGSSCQVIGNRATLSASYRSQQACRVASGVALGLARPGQVPSGLAKPGQAWAGSRQACRPDHVYSYAKFKLCSLFHDLNNVCQAPSWAELNWKTLKRSAANRPIASRRFIRRSQESKPCDAMPLPGSTS